MKIVYHIGLHCTDEGRLLRCLTRNADVLRGAGCVVPLPSTFRPVLRDAMIEFRGAPTPIGRQDAMLDAILDDGEPDRVIFSSDNFLCPPQRAIEGSTLYPLAKERTPWIANLFPEHDAVIALAMRNPVTLLPALHARFGNDSEFAGYLSRIEPDALSWSDAVERIHEAAPDLPLIVWCNEDSPLIWPEVIAALSGVGDPMALDGIHELLGTIMSEIGLSRMQSYLDSHPPRTVEHRRRVISAFLDKFALSDLVEMEVSAPGWTEDRVSRITARYEADIVRIAEMERVTLIAP